MRNTDFRNYLNEALVMENRKPARKPARKRTIKESYRRKPVRRRSLKESYEDSIDLFIDYMARRGFTLDDADGSSGFVFASSKPLDGSFNFYRFEDDIAEKLSELGINIYPTIMYSNDTDYEPHDAYSIVYGYVDSVNYVWVLLNDDYDDYDDEGDNYYGESFRRGKKRYLKEMALPEMALQKAKKGSTLSKSDFESGMRTVEANFDAFVKDKDMVSAMKLLRQNVIEDANKHVPSLKSQGADELVEQMRKSYVLMLKKAHAWYNKLSANQKRSNEAKKFAELFKETLTALDKKF